MLKKLATKVSQNFETHFKASDSSVTEAIITLAKNFLELTKYYFYTDRYGSVRRTNKILEEDLANRVVKRVNKENQETGNKYCLSKMVRQ